MAEALAERWVKHSPTKVWRALSEPVLVARWLPFDDYRPVVGHRFRARGPDGPAQCEVLEVDAPSRVVLSWVEGTHRSQVVLSLDEDRGGTRVRIRHADVPPTQRNRLVALWLAALQGPLEGVLVGSVVSAGLGLSTLGLAVGGAVGGAVALAVWLLAPLLGTEPPSAGSEAAEVAGPVAATTEAVTWRRPDPVRSEPDAAVALEPPPSFALGPTAGAWVVYETALPTSLHGLFPQNEVDERFHALIYDRLFERSAITGELRSAVATAWERQGSDLVVTLKPGLRFHDGQPLTAVDVCHSVKALLVPSTTTRLGFREKGDLLGCDVTKPLEATLHFRAAFADAPARGAVPILPAHTCAPVLTDDCGSRPVGSGPYKATRGRRAVRLEAFDNPHHHAQVPLWLFEEGGDPLVQARLLLRAVVVGIVDVDLTAQHEIRASDTANLKTYDPRAFYYLALNPERFPLPGDRETLGGVIDRAKLLDTQSSRDDVLRAPLLSGPFLSSSAFTNRRVHVPAVDPTAKGSGTVRLGFPEKVTRAEQFMANELVGQLTRGNYQVEVVRAEGPDPRRMDLWFGRHRVGLTEDPSSLLAVGPLGARSEGVEALLKRMDDASTDTEQQDAAHELHTVVAEEGWLQPLLQDVRKSAWRVEVNGNTISPGDYWGEVEGWTVVPSAVDEGEQPM